MDDIKRSTLELIESLVDLLKEEDAGNQLILLAYEYLEDYDFANTIRVLKKIPISYLLSGKIAINLKTDTDLRKAIGRLIGEFGEDLTIFSRGIKE